MITQWSIYALPDGARVYASRVDLADGRGTRRWQFYTADDQPLLIEDDQRRGSLLLLTLDRGADCYRVAPCDLTLADLRATGEKLQ